MIFWGINGGQWDSTGYEEHMDYFRPEGDEMGANLNAYYPRPLLEVNKTSSYKVVTCRMQLTSA